MNLLEDRWIPVRLKGGGRKVIAPWEMVDEAIAAPDWPRADLNIACCELLIGLVFMAAPPADVRAWRDGITAERLRDALAPFAAAFDLLGDGPRFLQEQGLDGDPSPPDMLFIDSAGGSTAKKNADLMVRRNRYDALRPDVAAMALYTLQAFAPLGGAGNRTSMRGGGPMVTLVDPGGGLWSLIWANVPYGHPATPDDLPWMRAPRLSQPKGSETWPEQAHPVEAFFGQPRRLRLIADAGSITGIMQKPWGTNYAGWVHPLSPYYRQKAGAELRPVHPKPGGFGYRNWLGIVARQKDDKDMRRRAATLEDWQPRARGQQGPPATLIVAGWAMSNMTPRTFLHSVQPLLTLPDARDGLVEQMILAADKVGVILRGALKPVLSEGEAREAVREDFFARTEGAFLSLVARLQDGSAIAPVAEDWIAALRRAAIQIFDARAVPALASRTARRQQEIVTARRTLLAIGAKTFPDLVLHAGIQTEEA